MTSNDLIYVGGTVGPVGAAIPATSELSRWIPYIPAVSAAIASLAFLFAVLKQSWDQRLQREARATSAWQDYLKLSFDNPELAAVRVNLDVWSADGERYEWYVHRMLYAAETVLIYAPNDVQWNSTISSQIKLHREYIGGRARGEVAGYSPQLKTLIYLVIDHA